MEHRPLELIAGNCALADLHLISENTRKPDRIRDIIHDHLGKITKAEIMAQCPDISKTTVERALTDLVKSGEVIKIGGGRYTSYTWNREID